MYRSMIRYIYVRCTEREKGVHIHAQIKYIYKIQYYEYNNNTEINHNITITFILIKQVSDMIYKLPYYKCNNNNLLPCSLCIF